MIVKLIQETNRSSWYNSGCVLLVYARHKYGVGYGYERMTQR